MGDASGMGDVGMPWGYLGQDDSGIEGPTLDQAGLTVGDLVDYASSGTTSDPSTLDAVANIFKTAAPAVNSILQQVQFGGLAQNVPLSQLSQLRAAVTGAPVSTSAIVSSVASSPYIWVAAGVVIFMLMRRK
jgi:hypothetical protein